EPMATGPCTEQIELRLLDAVLRLAPGAVQAFVQLHGIRVGNVGDHEARVHALGPVFQAGQHAPGPLPRPSRVGELADQALLEPGALIVVLEDFFCLLNASLEALVARQANDVLHAAAFTPAQQRLTTEPRVPANDDPELGPCLA